jgi:hypothetical protein
MRGAERTGGMLGLPRVAREAVEDHHRRGAAVPPLEIVEPPTLDEDGARSGSDHAAAQDRARRSASVLLPTIVTILSLR